MWGLIYIIIIIIIIIIIATFDGAEWLPVNLLEGERGKRHSVPFRMTWPVDQNLPLVNIGIVL